MQVINADYEKATPTIYKGFNVTMCVSCNEVYCQPEMTSYRFRPWTVLSRYVTSKCGFRKVEPISQ